VRGTVPLGGAEVVREAAVDNPTLFFARTLRAALQARRIAVTGEAVDIDDLPDAGHEGKAGPATQPAPRVLLRHLSPPLSEIAKRLMKVSQNLYAETFLRVLSLTPGPATVAASQKVEEEVLASWGVAPGNYALADGSGLSRHNLVSADTIVKILRAMATDPADAQAFEATLPIAGKDGTISSRMKATRAENNVRAKTGTLMHVRALSGYLTTADGERLVFSIIANHFTVPTKAVDTAVDTALERLANFTRQPR
jgi:D-alanyl-D-alanine carboxypeptidase/D-alanyl-D-alanine-endopeptidase (penicillin-binding protein 4)